MSEQIGNISSLVLTLRPDCDFASIKEQVASIASIEAAQDDKVVVLVESPDTNGQIAAYRALEKIAGIAHVAMIYSYEDPSDTSELNTRSMNEIMDKLEKTPVEEIKYSGKVNI